MKTAKPPSTAAEALPPRRSQPVRQTRTNPPRAPGAASRGIGRDGPVGHGGHEQPIDIFPGVTHFADTITALPKELVKHFTLLKEVDAKIHVPQQALFLLIDHALRMPTPNVTRSPYYGTPLTASVAAILPAATPPPELASVPVSVPMSAQNSNNGTTPYTQRAQTVPTGSADPAVSAVSQPQGADDALSPSNLPRRRLFRQVAVEIKEMLVALEEKNHVISTANDALNKQLARIDDIWPHLEQEFSEEAKWGSGNHWAYPENRAAHRAQHNAQAERSRREGAANLSAAAQQIADEAAARSDARKQAIAAKRSQKNNHHDSDADSHRQKGDTKKTSGSKSRKQLPDANAASNVGLGLSGLATAMSATSSRRKKTEKPTGGQPMERALSGVFGASSSSRTRTASPRESPAPDGGSKKRKALPANGNQAKKTRNSTSAAPSPVIGAFPDLRIPRGSPALAHSTLVPSLPGTTGRFDDISLALSSGMGGSSGIGKIETANGTTAVGNVGKVNETMDAAKMSTPVPLPHASGAIHPASSAEAGACPGASEQGAATGGNNVAATVPNGGAVATVASEGGEGTVNHAAIAPPETLAPVQTPILPPLVAESGSLVTVAETQPNGNSINPPLVKEAPAVVCTPETADKAVPSDENAATVAAAPPIGSATRGSESLKAEKADSPPMSATPAKAEGVVAKKESTPAVATAMPAVQPAPVTTKSGRASKPSTPALATFGEAMAPRSRSSRASEAGGSSYGNSNGNGNSNGSHAHGSGSGNTSSSSSSNGTAKRSHKKGASISSQAHAHAQALVATGSSGAVVEVANGLGNGYMNSSSGHGHGSHGNNTSTRQQHQRQHQDDDDPLYCYCQQISFGEMIACDAENCAREWFHLECVGLRVAPKANVKWYCDDCKKRLKVGDRKTSGR